MTDKPRSARVNSTKKKRKPIERDLPSKPDAFLPESSLYTRLLNFERQLDATIARKHVELNEALRSPLRAKSILRIYISNDVHADPASGVPASWTLRIQGALLDADGTPSRHPQRCLSNFIHRLVIQHDQDSEHFAEWRKATAAGMVDGFEFHRIGDDNCKVRITLWLDSSPARYKLERSLAQALNIETGTRVQLLTALWNFIQDQNLMDEASGHVRGHSDLSGVFGADPLLPMHVLLKRFALFFQPPDPLVFKYKVRVDETPAPVCYDIKVDPLETWNTSLSSALAPNMNLQLHKLQEEINLLITNTQHHIRRREFMLAFAEAPVECIQGMVVSQATELAATNPKLLDAEAARTVAYYEQNWVPDAVDRYLSSSQFAQ